MHLQMYNNRLEGNHNLKAIFVETSRDENLIPSGTIVVKVNDVGFHQLSTIEELRNAVHSGLTGRLKLSVLEGLKFGDDHWIDSWRQCRKKLSLRTEFRDVERLQRERQLRMEAQRCIDSVQKNLKVRAMPLTVWIFVTYSWVIHLYFAGSYERYWYSHLSHGCSALFGNMC